MWKKQDIKMLPMARRQHGVVGRGQLEEIGFTDQMIRSRVAAKAWITVTPGVYQLATTEWTFKARAMAALLSIGDSVLSHETASHLHVFPYVERSPIVVTVPPNATNHSKLARIHQYDGIEAEDIVQVANMNTTSRALTLMHLSAVFRPTRLARILDDQLASQQVSIDELFALVEFWTRPGRPSRKVMRALLAERGHGYVATASELEAAFVDLVERFDLPPFTRQFRPPWLMLVNGRVDFALLGPQLIVELDGRRWHAQQEQMTKDRERDRAAQLNGYLVLRYGWYEVTKRPAVVAREILQAIELRAQATV